MLLILLAAVPPFLAAQTQPVTRTMFESSTPESYVAVTLTTSGSVWGGPAKYTNDSATGAVAYMLLGTLKGCEFANAETDRGSKVYVRTRELGRFSDYEPQEACRKTSSAWTTSWTGLRMTHILFFDESSPSNTSEAAYNETTQAYSIDTATQFSPVSFPEGTFTTRSVAENSFAGINVGSPVSAVGGDALTYTLSGTDAGSFSIVSDTGQIRTKDGVTYDYETKDRYSVTVGAQDDSDNTDSIAVTIEIEDLGPACMAPPDFRGIPEDGSVSVSWTPLEDTAGNARVRGYQVEMRQGSNGIWGTTRTLLGRQVPGTVYSNLVNSTSYQFRIRPLQVESDCEWHESELVTPQLSQQAPLDPDEHFRRVGRRPVGTSERNYRFLSPERCRHTTGGSTLDATCRYANTSPSSGTITLEFDDPSKAGCEVSLAYSSLTAGSFHDECFGAGVSVAVEFDTSFRLPPLPEAEEQDIPRAPRSQEEFDVLAWGREDLIPGLGFGCLPVFEGCGFTPGDGYRFRRDPNTGVITYTPGSYSYAKTGAAQGILTFQDVFDETFVFTLDFLPSGRMQVTVADADGNSPGWPGMPDTLLEGSSLPVLLPIPPSWSAAIEIEMDFAPEDIDALSERIPTPADPDDFYDHEPRANLVERLLLGEVWDRLLRMARTPRPDLRTPDGEAADLTLSWTPTYEKLGRNRAVWTISLSWRVCSSASGVCHDVDWDDPSLSEVEFQRGLHGTTLVFDISFLTEDSGNVKVTLQREGESPTTLRRFLDLKAGSSGTDSFPNELTLPDEAPQASGQDITEVQIAPVTTPEAIGENDIQTFLVNNVGSQPASYSPGDWLEPKDGGTQRMMVVASGQAATAGPASQALPSKVQDSIMPARLARRAELRSDQSPASLPPPPRQQSMNPALTQISVVCMQFDRDIPRRGTRYFSQPKTAEGEVQTCQKECVTAGGEAIQRCVWSCETNPSGETTTPSFGSATAGNQSYQAGTAISPLTLPAASGGDGSLAYSLAPGVPGLSFNAATRVLAGTPTAAGTYAMTYTVSDTDGDLATLNFVVTVATAQMTTVDLVVSSVTASDDTPGSGQSFDLTAATGNSGTAASAATTLRFYRSTNTTISSSDTQVGTAAVGALAAGGTGSSVLTLTAPSTAGTYYYGACVDRVTGESNSQNNCSSAVTVTVSASQMASAGFDLHADNGSPTGITFANDRFFVVDWDDDKAYAYQASGQRDAAADFALDSANGRARGITFANDRFFVVDWDDDKAYAYQASGQRDAAADFALDSANGVSEGITFANDRFFVVDRTAAKVYAYTAAGQRDAAADFDLDSANGGAKGLAFANDRFYVADNGDDKVYAYTAAGQRDAAADFALDSANGIATGITFANNRFFAVDWNDKVYPYSAGTTDSQPSFGAAAVGNQSYQAGTAISPLTLPAASGGDGSLTYSVAPGVPGLSFSAATRVLSGTPTAAGTYAMTYAVSDADGDLATLTFVVTVATAQMTTIDLVVSSVSASDDTPGSGQSFDLTATTSNSGTAASAATTLRFYRSTNTTISSSDTQVGTAAVGALAAGGTGSSVLTLTAPSTAGTYYYGACVDRVTGESNSQNNCSSAVTVTVSASQMASAGFDLHADNGSPTGITFANDRFFVVDWDDDKAYAYQASGQRDAAADFDLDSANGRARGITFANDRFFVVDWDDDKAYAYQPSGQRDAAADFALDSANGVAEGITFANDRFFVVDRTAAKVYAYTAAGQRDAAADFDLDSANAGAKGIAFANDRFYVVDNGDDKVYVYTAAGQRDAAADFDLDSANGIATGITFANGRFFAVDWNDKVYPYSAGTTDSQPSFGAAAVSNNTYTAGTAISPLTLPAASGGDGSLTYSLAPGVSGLSFSAATRVLSGTPTAAGTYAMTYAVSDADGDLATLTFVVTVATAQMTTVDLVVSSVSASDDTPGSGQSFDLTATTSNSGTAASAAATVRFYRSTDTAISSSDTQVGTAAVGTLAASGTSSSVLTVTAPSTAGTYYYGACVDQVSGESNSQNNCSTAVRITVRASQMESAGFDLASVNRSPQGITFANDRFYVVNSIDDKVYAYTASGQHEPASDFTLDSDNVWATGITFANNRFYVVDRVDDRVYAYTASGQYEPASNFSPDAANAWATGITFANDRFYVVDIRDDKVYAYYASGQRDAAADFDLDAANGSAQGITFANNRFYVVDGIDDKVYAYTAPGQHEPASDFALDAANASATGIVFANSRFYLVDLVDAKVYAGAAPGTADSQPSFGSATAGNQSYQAGTAISPLTLPAASGGDGSLTYRLAPGVPGLSFNGATRVLAGTPTAAGTYGMTYTVRDADGDLATLSFVVTVSSAQMTTVDLGSSVSASDDTLQFGQSFDLTATTSNSGTVASAATTLRFYRSTDTAISSSDTQVGTAAVSALATAGTGSSVLTLTAPSTAGTYYYGACVDQVSGESNFQNNCSTAVRVTVRAELAGVNSSPQGITFANNRFYVVDFDDDKVYAYTASGQHEPDSNFDLDSANESAHGITFANDRFYVVDFDDDKVYAYTASGQHEPDSDFDLDAANGSAQGITFANDRFYVVDGFDDKVYAYTASGQHEPDSDFDLDAANGSAQGITFANDRFYVVDGFDDKVYAYTASGQHEPDSDFDLDAANRAAEGITFANNRFYVVDNVDAKIYAY